MKNNKYYSWKKIWNNRDIKFLQKFSTLEKLMLLNGHLKSVNEISVQNWVKYGKEIKKRIKIKKNESIFEFGAGSGALLYLFKDNLYLSKPPPKETSKEPREHSSFALDNVCLLDVDKSKLEMVLNVNVSQIMSAEGTLKSTLSLRRSTSMKKSKGPATVTLVFHEYNDFVEWSFKLKNVLGKYY